MLKKTYYLAIEGSSASASASIQDAPIPAPSSLPTEPALEAVSTGMTLPPPPRPPRSDSVAAARREHSRAFSDGNVTQSLEVMSVEGGGGRGGTIPNGAGEHSGTGYGSSLGSGADGFVDAANQPASLQQAGDHDSDTGDLNGGNTGA